MERREPQALSRVVANEVCAIERVPSPGTLVRSPGAILLSQTNHHGVRLLVELGKSWHVPLLGAVTLLCHQLPVPGQNGVEFVENIPIRLRESHLISPMAID
jgi:hypothetical protein